MEGIKEENDTTHDNNYDNKTKVNKTVRKRTSTKTVIKPPQSYENDITKNMKKLLISDEKADVPENINILYSKSGNYMFKYSNKKTPFENACPWLLE